MTDDAIPQRRRTDGAITQWISVGISAVLAIGGTSAFTFNVYDALRTQLVELSTLQPTLTAHIRADTELQRICQSRTDYLERKLDAIMASSGANAGAIADYGLDRAAALDALAQRLLKLEGARQSPAPESTEEAPHAPAR